MVCGNLYPSGYGKWSNNTQPTNFNTSTTLHVAATFIEPKNDVGTEFYPNYKWGKVDTATYYHLYVSGPSGRVRDQWYKASDICLDTSCSVRSPLLGVGSHVWYVQPGTLPVTVPGATTPSLPTSTPLHHPCPVRLI